MRRTTAIVFGLGLAGWLASAVLLWSAPVLGHDEAQYAIAAHDWLAGNPVRWVYLSYGMNLVAAPGVLAGGGEQALRVLPLLLGVGFLVAGAHLARKVTSARTAAWLVATFAGTLSIAKRSSELLSDLPAAACLLVALALIVDELDRDTGPRWRVVFTAPLFAAAFYLRYGSCIPIAMIGLAAIAFGWRSIARRPLPALATVALLTALLVPHLAYAIRETGKPLGIMLESTTVIGSGIGASLVVYLTSNPFAYYGFTAPILAGGIASIIQIRDRRRAFLWTVALLDLVAVGLTPTPQARYIVTAMVLFGMLGIDAIDHLLASRPPRVRVAVAALAGIALLASWAETIIAVHRLASTSSERYAPTLLAASAIRRDTAGQPCEVICRHTTQLAWYSGCANALDASPESIRRAHVYVIIEPHGEHQPDLQGLPSPKLVTVLDDPTVTVTRVDP